MANTAAAVVDPLAAGATAAGTEVRVGVIAGVTVAVGSSGPSGTGLGDGAGVSVGGI